MASELVDVKLINGTARTVSELFANRKYGLDYYQREYTWTEANVTELLSDLSAAFQHDYDPDDERHQVAAYRPYFLGPLVTSTVGGIRFLVDGQQRLTTLTLLLIHLDHLLAGVDGAGQIGPLIHSSKFGKTTFNIDVDERVPVMEAVLHQKPFDTAGATASVENIWARYQDIVELFPDDIKADDQTLLCFTDWLLERVVLVEIGTTDQDMALEIFETMNDRGLRLSNTDMLKGFVLARMGEPSAIELANELWRRRVGELVDVEKNADAEFIKTWLRGKYADTIRDRKKDASARDFDLIGTAFHKWVRDNAERIGLRKASEFQALVSRDFESMSGRYLSLLSASSTLTSGLEAVYYNSVNGFTLQFLPIIAAVTPDDDDDTFNSKARLVSSYLDLMIARRMVNYRNFGYSTLVYTMFVLAKDLRDKSLDEVRDVLADRVADISESFDGVHAFNLTQRNRAHIRYLLARMTAWIERQCGKGDTFAQYVDRGRKDPYEVEHIWANHHSRHVDEFANPYDFENFRNRFGGLVLLPKSFNASYGDNPYEEKLPHYFGQNLLAASLNPLAYENNPSFTAFRNATGLPFQPHEESFAKADLEKRQDLYRQICEQVWDPETLGLGGGTSTGSLSDDEKRAFYGVGLADLMNAGLLAPGTQLVGSRSGQTFTVTVDEGARLLMPDGSVRTTPSGAADVLTGASNNGWDFWRTDIPGDNRTLGEIRTAFLGGDGAEAP